MKWVEIATETPPWVPDFDKRSKRPVLSLVWLMEEYITGFRDAKGIKPEVVTLEPSAFAMLTTAFGDEPICVQGVPVRSNPANTTNQQTG